MYICVFIGLYCCFSNVWNFVFVGDVFNGVLSYDDDDDFFFFW